MPQKGSGRVQRLNPSTSPFLGSRLVQFKGNRRNNGPSTTTSEGDCSPGLRRPRKTKVTRTSPVHTLPAYILFVRRSTGRRHGPQRFGQTGLQPQCHDIRTVQNIFGTLFWDLVGSAAGAQRILSYLE
ncbi:hypothetical protein KCU88_g225, partial [Aureobasidium melanogenum]